MNQHLVIRTPTPDEIKARRERLWGKPASQAKNIIVEIRRAKEQAEIEQARRDAEKAAKAIERREALIAYKVDLARRKALRAQQLDECVQTHLVARLDKVDNGNSPSAIEVGYEKPSRTIARIVSDVLKEHPGVTLADVLSKTRKVKVFNARAEMMATIKATRPSISFPQIGLYFGRDHTSVINAINKFNGREPANLPRRTEDIRDVTGIKNDYDAGMTYVAIGAKYGLNEGTISNIAKRLGWKRGNWK